jgi:hypothetical protein
MPEQLPRLAAAVLVALMGVIPPEASVASRALPQQALKFKADCPLQYGVLNAERDVQFFRAVPKHERLQSQVYRVSLPESDPTFSLASSVARDRQLSGRASPYRLRVKLQV